MVAADKQTGILGRGQANSFYEKYAEKAKVSVQMLEVSLLGVQNGGSRL